ncbi:MAG: S1C family serine protease [Kiritimatiellia bacterium]
MSGLPVFPGRSATEETAAAWEVPAVRGLGDLAAIQKRVQELLPKVTPAVVGLDLRGGAGSGVVVSADGLILTAGHVVMEPGLTIQAVFGDGRKLDANTLGASYFSDAGMARLAGSNTVQFVELAPDGSARVGDWCFALGHPGGVDEKRGLVLRIGRIISRRSDVLRTDCTLIGGDSGGPLFDLQGRVIAIHSRISRSPDDNFHVPVEAFRKGWEGMLASRVLRPGGAFFGVMMEEHEKGVKVGGVVKGSAAERAGIRPGDIITHFDDRVVIDPPDLRMAIGGRTSNDTVRIEFLRGATSQEARVKLGDWRELKDAEVPGETP